MRSELFGICLMLGFKRDARQIEMLMARVDRLKGGQKPKNIEEWISCVTVKETRFFRDIEQFRALELFLREQLGAGVKKLRLWSAGCAFGQEPYSMAMVAARVYEELGSQTQLEILASDIDVKALQVAAAGAYPITMLTQIPETYRCYIALDGNQFRVKDTVRRSVEFFCLNLAGAEAYPEELDAVFCRNVLIYLDTSVAVSILMRIHAALKPGGLLFMGEGETVTHFGLSTTYEAVGSKCLFYRKLKR